MTEEDKKLFERLRSEEWYNTRPQVIKDAINKIPPVIYYKFKNSGKQCYIVAFTEPDEENKEVTLTVQKTGEGGAMAKMGLGVLDTNQVFGVHIEDLEPWEN